MQFQCGFLQYRQTDRQTHKTPCYLRVKDKSIDCMYRFSVYIGKTGLSGGRGQSKFYNRISLFIDSKNLDTLLEFDWLVPN